jgi:hypothetical protein
MSKFLSSMMNRRFLVHEAVNLVSYGMRYNDPNSKRCMTWRSWKQGKKQTPTIFVACYFVSLFLHFRPLISPLKAQHWKTFKTNRYIRRKALLFFTFAQLATRPVFVLPASNKFLFPGQKLPAITAIEYRHVNYVSRHKNPPFDISRQNKYCMVIHGSRKYTLSPYAVNGVAGMWNNIDASSNQQTNMYTNVICCI